MDIGQAFALIFVAMLILGVAFVVYLETVDRVRPLPPMTEAEKEEWGRAFNREYSRFIASRK